MLYRCLLLFGALNLRCCVSFRSVVLFVIFFVMRPRKKLTGNESAAKAAPSHIQYPKLLPHNRLHYHIRRHQTRKSSLLVRPYRPTSSFSLLSCRSPLASQWSVTTADELHRPCNWIPFRQSPVRSTYSSGANHANKHAEVRHQRKAAEKRQHFSGLIKATRPPEQLYFHKRN